MGRLANGELSQSSRAIKWRANKTVKNARIALEKQGKELIIGGDVVMSSKAHVPRKPDSDAIGVFSDDTSPAGPTESAIESDAQTYYCNNCRGTVHQGEERCGVCEQRLDWARVER
jgi:hypothetical protein